MTEGTRIIQHEFTKQYIATHFKGDTEFMMQNFGQGHGIEEIKLVAANVLITKDGKLTLGLGGKSACHCQAVFALVVLDEHPVETLTSLQKAYDFLPEDTRVVPGHGSVMMKKDLKWHIDYLATVKKEVECGRPDAGTAWVAR